MIRVVNPLDYLDQIRELIAMNWRETGCAFDLDLNVELFKALHDAGLLISLIAFDGDEAVGYATAFIGPHIFNASVVECSSSALFVHPEYRNGSIAGRLMLDMERIAKERGATQMDWGVKPDSRLYETLASRDCAISEYRMTRVLQ